MLAARQKKKTSCVPQRRKFGMEVLVEGLPLELLRDCQDHTGYEKNGEESKASLHPYWTTATRCQPDSMS